MTYIDIWIHMDTCGPYMWYVVFWYALIGFVRYVFHQWTKLKLLLDTAGAWRSWTFAARSFPASRQAIRSHWRDKDGKSQKRWSRYKTIQRVLKPYTVRFNKTSYCTCWYSVTCWSTPFHHCRFVATKTSRGFVPRSRTLEVANSDLVLSIISGFNNFLCELTIRFKY